MVTGDLPTATQVFERLREANPGDARSRMMLFDLALRTQPQETLDAAELAAFQTAQFERLRLLIDEISQIPGMTFLSEYGRAVQLVLEFDAAGAGTAVGDRPEELTRDMLQRLDKAQAHLDTAGQARRKWNRLWHLRGEVHDRRQNILNAAGDQLWTKEFEAATDAYREAFECGLRTPEFVAKMLAYLYRAGRYVDAAQALTSLQAGQTPSLVSVAQTAAELSDQLGDSDRWSLDTLAIDAARQAAEGTGHDDPSVQLAYGNILLWHEQADEAAQVFQRVRDLAPKELGLWQQLMIALRRIDALRQSKTPDAPSTLEQTLRDTLAAAQLVLSKPDFGVLAGNAYQLLGDRVEARARYVEELAAVPADLRQATASQVELLSEAAAFFLQEAGSNAESAQIVDTLLKRLDSEGATVYRELRDARREQGNRGEITPLERQLAVAVPVARRHMATMTMGRSDVASLEAALAALGRNREIRYTDEDKRIEALIKSRWNTRERREEGISLLASILSGSLVPLATDRLLLATMHLAEYQSLEEERALRELAYGEADPEVVLLAAAAKRHLTAAREQSRVIILSGSRGSAAPGDAAATSVDGAYLAALSQQIEILLSSQETADAEFYLEKLKQAAPGSPSTTVLEARVKFALGQHDEVRALLQKLVEGAAPENRVGAMASIAQLLEGFGTQSGDASQPPGADYFGAAEQLLQQVAQDGPDQRMLLASYYGRRGRTAEGLELIAAEAATARQLELANACAQVMRGIG
ncbi:MAG: hypothetical protein JNG89_02925, partial [Planctomycetaceae bacterium]|nr:hypothetical protein [Planctomycetaceae bacterium]